MLFRVKPQPFQEFHSSHFMNENTTAQSSVYCKTIQ
jgi:hypothetical protein